MHQSILEFGRRRYLWIALGLCTASLLAYALHDPPEPPNGGTWLGYTLGTIGALLILWLTAFGVRKRSYASRLGTVQGWLSAHVYLGTALLLVVTLHTGFQFGANVHTAAYVLTCLMVASGAFGTVMYLRLPERMNANRASANREGMVAEVVEIDRQAARLAGALPAEYGELVASHRDRTVLGGGAWALLAGLDRSRVVLPGAGGQRPVPNARGAATLRWLTDRLARNTEGQLGPHIQDLLQLMTARRAAQDRLREDLRLQAWLDIWLWFHVPLAFALLAALLAHVVAVFLYW